MKFKLDMDYPIDTLNMSEIITIYNKLDSHMGKYPLGKLLNGDVVITDWEKEMEEMKEISLDFPSILFKLTIYDLEVGNLGFLQFFKNGKFYVKELILSFPTFDGAKLK